MRQTLGLCLCLCIASSARATPVGGPIVQLVKRVRSGVVNVLALTNGEGGRGTGFIVSSAGDVLTNNHVVAINGQNAQLIVVQLEDGRKVRAQVVARDPRTDIALLHIPNDRLQAAVLGNSDELEVGEQVVAIGNPRGLGFSVTTGIVSAKGRRDANNGDEGAYVDYIQTDTAINHGNSGGPLFNMRGEVVGINSAIRADSQNIGFVIPINVAKHVSSDLRKFGKVQRGWLGFSAEPPSTDPLAVTEGATVGAVVSGSPAAEGGLKAGDLVLRFDGVRVEDARHLRWLCADAGIGKNINLSVKRQGKLRDIKLVSTAQPE